MKEIWKDVKGYEGLYEVSSLGRIKSIERNGTLGGIRKFKINKFGYPCLQLYKNNKPKDFFIHRIVSEAFIDNPENKPFVNHIDGDKLNNSVNNLEWVTQSENELHAFRTGLKKPCKGENHYNSKITDKEVKELRRLAKTTKQIDLCDKYNLSKAQVCRIINKTRRI